MAKQLDDDIVLTIQNTDTIQELVDEFTALLGNNFDSTTSMRGQQRVKANELAKQILAKYNGDYSNVSEEDKAKLRDYTGFGGIGGSTNEYYTPTWVAQATWEALAAYGFTGGNVLEPSAGVGVFSETKPKGVLNTSIEMDQTSAAINQILHPEDRVVNSAFEAIAKSESVSGFDAVIGNPPYGARDGSAMNDKEYKDIAYADQYFVTRAIDKAKAGGLIALILPTRICDSKQLEKWRVELALKAEFLGAHRLPTGTFADTGVVTDLVIWRKHSEDGQQLIDEVKNKQHELINSKVIWHTWTKGQWFEKDGKQFINGVQSIKGVGKFARKVVDGKGLTNESIKKSMSHKFESRINWEMLGNADAMPTSLKYANGDTIIRNGLQYEMIDGDWVVSADNAKQGNIDPVLYGVDDSRKISSITYSNESLLNLDFSHVERIFDDYQSLCNDEFVELMFKVKRLPSDQREYAFKGVLLGKKVATLNSMYAVNKSKNASQSAFTKGDQTQSDADEYRNTLSRQLQDFYAESGKINIKAKDLNKLGDNLKGDLKRFESAVAGGELSQLMQGRVSAKTIRQYDHSNIADVMHFCLHELGEDVVTVDLIRLHYDASNIQAMDDDQLLDYLSTLDDVAIGNEGNIQPMHMATTGEVMPKIALLQEQLLTTTSEPIRANIMRQLETIDVKREKVAIDDLGMKLTDKWIPKEIMLEFLHDSGYSDFVRGYHKKTSVPALKGDGTQLVDDEGQPVFHTYTEFIEDPNGEEFSGYRFRRGDKRNNKDEKFERQIESYINYGKVQGGTGKKADLAKSLVRSEIHGLDETFTNWLKGSDYADQLETIYNNLFKTWVKPEFDTSPIPLEGTSGAIEFKPYQNATIRRHSADGNGILALGTGLGKTLTGLGLIQHNLDTNRASRVAIVVPKSVLENWFYESDLFFGESNLADKVFVGLDVSYGDDGKIVREPLLDEQKQPKMDAQGRPILRPKVKVNISKAADQLHQIAQSDHVRVVVMTKDTYSRIPMMPESISDHVLEMKEKGLISGSGRLVEMATNHREKTKNSNFEKQFSNDGTNKNQVFPYFEELKFDNVMVDEAHDFRNSYKGGSYRNNLAYLPSQREAARAIDMQVKNDLIKRGNGGKGVYFLTATPTVNSPVDIFNMLSHVVPPRAFAELGIFDSDDFLRMFGMVEEAEVTTLSGTIENREALKGFQNLDALRGIINRYMTMEDAKTVGATGVHIPELIAQNEIVNMNDEQKELYHELRFRAAILNASQPPTGMDLDEFIALKKQYEGDTVFGLIRKMDKISTDLDLYHNQVTYRFPADNKEQVEKLLKSKKLPKNIIVKQEVVDENGDISIVDVTVPIEYDVTIENGHAVVRLRQEFDDIFSGLCRDNDLQFSHPVSPKYAKFLDKAKAVYLADNKQLVFTEEKSQHKKLARIIADHVGCKLSEIGIINSDTVAGLKGSREFEKPSFEGMTDAEAAEALATWEEQADEAGLEHFANLYNTGKYRFMILNKKGEVGINLHHGTTDVHHLTLPWTPMSLTQRNGRAARIGSTQQSVNVHYYVSAGSFDEFRRKTIDRKAGWVDEMFKGTGKSVKNADADDDREVRLMLAENPEEFERLEALELAKQEKEKLERLRTRAINDMSRYAKASATLNVDIESAKQELENLEAKTESIQQDYERYDNRIREGSTSRYDKDDLRKAKAKLDAHNKRLKQLQKSISEREQATNVMKRLRPSLIKASEAGVLDDYPDFLEMPELYMVESGKVIRQDRMYEVYYKANSFTPVTKCRFLVESLDRVAKTAKGMLHIHGNDERERVSSDQVVEIDSFIKLLPVDIQRTKLELLAKRGVALQNVHIHFDRETYQEFLSLGLITSYTGSYRGEWLVYRGGKLSVIKNSEKQDSDIVVYPDPSDMEVKQFLLDFTAKEMEEKGSIHTDNIILSFFLGRDYSEQAQEHGTKATKDQVIERVRLEIKQYEESNQADYNKAVFDFADQSQYNHENHQFAKSLKDYLQKVKFTGYSNRDEIRKTLHEVFYLYLNELGNIADRKREEVIAQIAVRFVELVDNDPSRPKRLAQTAHFMAKYKREHDFTKNNSAQYSDDQDGYLMMFADIHAAGIRAYNVDDDIHQMIFNGSLWRAESEFANTFRYTDRKGDFIRKFNTPPAEVTKQVIMSESKQKQLSSTADFDFESLDAFANAIAHTGIKVQAVTKDLPWEKMVKSKTGQGKEKKLGKIKAFINIGLLDANGKDGALGKLFAGNANIKSKYKAYFNAKITDSDFYGAWWFISSQSDLKELAKELLEQL